MRKYLLALGLVTALGSTAALAYDHSYPRTAKAASCCFKIKDNPDGFLNMRTGPGVNFGIMTRVPSGMGDITIYARARGVDGLSMYPWCKSHWQGFTGWLSCAFLEKEAVE